MLTGRDQLIDTVRVSLAQQHAVVLTGEAGIGKTSVAQEVALGHSGPVLAGGALATLSWMEHLCLRRALGRDLEGSDAAERAAQVLEAVGSGLLVLEDLQWAHPATLDVVALLVGRIRLLATVRSGEAAGDEAVATLVQAGCLVVAVEPLPPDAARAVIRAVRADLAPVDESALLRRAGGNPLLLAELAAHDVPPASLRLAVNARLNRLEQQDRVTFGLLALAGRPVGTDAIGPAAVQRLVRAGLVEVSDDRVLVRHALVAEAAIDLMDPAQRRDSHRRLARLVGDRGEAARHHDLGGEPELARAAAEAAAEFATNRVERAGHLRLAARLASGADADLLRLRAAQALEMVHDDRGCLETLDAIVGTDPEVRAWAALLKARIAWAAGESKQMHAAIEDGLALTEGSTSEVSVRLRIERSRVPLFLDYDMQAGLASARDALELAERTGVAVHRAQYYLGTALGMFDDPAAVPALEAAIKGARAVDDPETERAAANNLISFHECSGDPSAGRALALAMIERAADLGLGSWRATFLVALAGLHYHAGELSDALATCGQIAALPGDVRSKDRAVELELLTLIDAGRIDEAERRAVARAAAAADDYPSQISLVRIRAEAALWGGHPRRALPLTEQYLDGLAGDANLAFGLSVRAWARWEAGLAPEPMDDLELPPLLAGLPVEVRGVHLLSMGNPDEAAVQFDRAAALWAPYHRRGELRCRWAHGEALRLAGHRERAVEVLERVETDAESLGHAAVLGKIRQSLRRAGVRRTAQRAEGGGGLTGREREVVELAGEGLTNAQIAARLGISRRSVVSLLERAATKLGATSRTHAAALARRLPAG